MYIAAICSLPGGFEVLILIRSASQPRASFAIAGVFSTDEILAGIPGPAAGATCAGAEKLVAITNTLATAMPGNIRFQFTNPSFLEIAGGIPGASKRFAFIRLHTNMHV